MRAGRVIKQAPEESAASKACGGAHLYALTRLRMAPWDESSVAPWHHPSTCASVSMPAAARCTLCAAPRCAPPSPSPPSSASCVPSSSLSFSDSSSDSSSPAPKASSSLSVVCSNSGAAKPVHTHVERPCGPRAARRDLPQGQTSSTNTPLQSAANRDPAPCPNPTLMVQPSAPFQSKVHECMPIPKELIITLKSASNNQLMCRLQPTSRYL